VTLARRCALQPSLTFARAQEIDEKNLLVMELVKRTRTLQATLALVTDGSAAS
jgi:hypothetical protein